MPVLKKMKKSMRKTMRMSKERDPPTQNDVLDFF